jgi:hypothetical protein
VLSASKLATTYGFNYRTGYTYQASIPLSRKGFTAHQWSLVFNDDIQINFGKQVVYNYFDQNRFLTAFNYQPNGHDNLMIGYMNVFQQLAAGNKYKQTNVIRAYYFHSIDLRRKKENAVRVPPAE